MKIQRTSVQTLTLNNLERWLENVSRAVSGNLTFGSTTSNSDPELNIECSKAAGTTPGTVNTEFSVAHVLNRVPITFFGHTDNGGVLYKSTTAWTKTQIFLKCTTASAHYSLVVI